MSRLLDLKPCRTCEFERTPGRLGQGFFQVFRSNDELTAALAPWLEHYKTRALGDLLVSRLSPT